ncbi:unnamed protein product [Cyprideis torosa]|uniref:Uncharacterized protein n=1 Tax=Cyprideis torosa TaxID=163714 RepID=A0A7R8WPN9_9CRUS|nr:unnamed protein product [Cyprideis torosa]CAG0905209.1 unnamed protein product [Cyprideis torosa]
MLPLFLAPGMPRSSWMTAVSPRGIKVGLSETGVRKPYFRTSELQNSAFHLVGLKVALKGTISLMERVIFPPVPPEEVRNMKQGLDVTGIYKKYIPRKKKKEGRATEFFIRD